jgi:DNA gyrase/topoisomerase IV subunit A
MSQKVMPARVPTLLNGATGIAVGMANQYASSQLKSGIDGTLAYIWIIMILR